MHIIIDETTYAIDTDEQREAAERALCENEIESAPCWVGEGEDEQRNGMTFFALGPAAEQAIKAEAIDDAASFFAEFGEALDPEATDWDSTAWEQSPHAWRGVIGFKVYQAALVAETERLAS